MIKPIQATIAITSVLLRERYSPMFFSMRITFLMNNLLAAFEKRDTFTLSEFGAAMSRMYSPDILKNADYYSFFVNLCQKQEYVIGGQTENESFLDDILSGAFEDREPVYFTITPKSAGAQDEQPMEQSELVFERKGTK